MPAGGVPASRGFHHFFGSTQKSPYLRYNFLTTAGSMLGFQHLKEVKTNLSLINMGGRNPRASRVVVRDLQGNIVKVFSTRKEAGAFLGIWPQSVSNAMKRGQIVKGKYRVSNA